MPEFQPLYPSHSIEQCAVALTFNEQLPAKSFGRALEIIAPAIRNLGLEPVAAQGFQFDLASGKMMPITDRQGPTQFVSADRTISYLVQPGLLALTTARYVRWEPFLGQVEQLIIPLLHHYVESLNVVGLQLEYRDTFIWSGSWDDFDWRQLLRPDSGYIVERASKAVRQWHSNSGWFEFSGDSKTRVLHKIDIEIVERGMPDSDPRPAIQILTTLRHDAVAPVGGVVTGNIPEDAILPVLGSLHQQLKSLFKSMIQEEVAARVGL